MKKIIALLPVLIIFLSIAPVQLNAQTFANLNVIQCDSLIQANINNPDFVILDVRTPGEHNPAHLTGAINRNYYDGDFYTQIGLLLKHKVYLVHCQSGGRSTTTYNAMQGMGFTEAYNMLGGMNSWNAASLPSTSAFGPLLMMVSDTVVQSDTTGTGNSDTITLTLTNRANSILTFSSITDLTGSEFSTDFNMDTTVSGAFDYTFHIIYSPTDESTDSLDFVISGNGGTRTVHIYATGVLQFPGIDLSADTLVGFGTVTVGNTDTVSMLIYSIGQAPLEIISTDDLSATEFGCNLTSGMVLPGDSLPVVFTYAPADENADTVLFSIVTNAGLVNIQLSGTGELLLPGIGLSADTLVGFGTVTVGNTDTVSMFIHSIGQAPLEIISTGDLSATEFGCNLTSGMVLPGDSLPVVFTYAPADENQDTAICLVQTNAGEIHFVLLGTGNIAVPLFSFVQDTIQYFDSITIGNSDSLEICIFNSGNADLLIASANDPVGTEFSTDFTGNQTVASAEYYCFTVFYSPTDSLSDTLIFTVSTNTGDYNMYFYGSSYNPLAVGNISDKDFILYPNPGYGLIHIETENYDPELSFRITDMIGRDYPANCIKTGISSYSLDVSGLPSGLFLVKANRHYNMTKLLIIK